MRKYFYEIVNTTSRQDGSPLTRVYIYAKPRFSHREMFAKQEQLLDKLTDPECPLDGAMQIAIASDMSVSALCFAKIDHFNKIRKEITFEFVHSLEIVIYKPQCGAKIVDWLSKIWTGTWKALDSIAVN